MSQPGLARLERFLSCSRTSGRPRRSEKEPNLASSTSMWSQSCSMEWNLKDDKDNATENPDILQHLSPAHLQHPMARGDPKWNGAGSDTPSGSQHPAPYTKLWPQGKRKRGRPRNSWRQDTEAELKQQGTNWTGAARLAQNRVRWRGVINGPCSTWCHRPE